MVSVHGGARSPRTCVPIYGYIDTWRVEGGRQRERGKKEERRERAERKRSNRKRERKEKVDLHACHWANRLVLFVIAVEAVTLSSGVNIFTCFPGNN